MAEVADLLAARARRGRNALHFETAPEALAFLGQRVADLRELADSSLLVSAADLDLPLSQIAAVLSAVVAVVDADNPYRPTDYPEGHRNP